MTNLKQKTNIGMAMMILFAITIVTGIILHLKKHGILIEPRTAIKTIHWLCGFGMSALTALHWKQFGKMLCAIKSHARWFYISTSVLKIILSLTLVTGAIKLLSPIKIPHLGLWHYSIGILMGLLTIIHLIRGIPSWRRHRKANQ